MAVSKKQQASVNKYVRENYDRINVTFPKGKKDSLKAHASKVGESLNAFINRAIDTQIAFDISGETAPAAASPAQSQTVPPEVTEHIKSTGESVEEFTARAYADTITRDKAVLLLGKKPGCKGGARQRMG